MKRTTNLLLIGAALLAIAATAAGDDRKAYHAAICRTDTVGGSSLARTATGVYVASSHGYFVCPLIRDRINSATSINSIVLEGYNSVASYNDSSCAVIAQTEDGQPGIGGTGNYVDVQVKYQSTAGPLNMTFDEIEASDGNEGAFSVFCDLPLGSSLYHIHVNENTSATE